MFNFTPPKITAGNALKGVAIATLLTVAGAATASADVGANKSQKNAKSSIGSSLVVQMASADRGDRRSDRRERRTDRRTDRRDDRDDRRTDRRTSRDDRRTDRRTDRRDDRRTDRRDRTRSSWPTIRRTYPTTRRTSTYRRPVYASNNRGYRTNYRSNLGISFHFGTPGYSAHRWASSPYFGYRRSYGSFGHYQSRTRCQRIILEGWHYGHRKLISVKECSNPWDGRYIVQGSERLVRR